MDDVAGECLLVRGVHRLARFRAAHGDDIPVVVRALGGRPDAGRLDAGRLGLLADFFVEEAAERYGSRLSASHAIMGSTRESEGASVGAKMTPAWIMYVADASGSFDGISWYEQGMVKNWRAVEGGVVGIVEESGGSEYKVKIAVTDGVLSSDCEDCFSGEPITDENGDEIGRLCVHGAAIAMAAAEDNVL